MCLLFDIMSTYSFTFFFPLSLWSNFLLTCISSDTQCAVQSAWSLEPSSLSRACFAVVPLFDTQNTRNTYVWYKLQTTSAWAPGASFLSFWREFHPGSQPSAPDVSACWPISHLRGVSGTSHRLSLCVLSWRSVEEKQILISVKAKFYSLKLPCLASVPHLRGLCVTRHRSGPTLRACVCVCARACMYVCVFGLSSFLFPCVSILGLVLAPGPANVINLETVQKLVRGAGGGLNETGGALWY